VDFLRLFLGKKTFPAQVSHPAEDVFPKWTLAGTLGQLACICRGHGVAAVQRPPSCEVQHTRAVKIITPSVYKRALRNGIARHGAAAPCKGNTAMPTFMVLYVIKMCSASEHKCYTVVHTACYCLMARRGRLPANNANTLPAYKWYYSSDHKHQAELPYKIIVKDAISDRGHKKWEWWRRPDCLGQRNGWTLL